jgi:hypothetical protein
MWKPRRLTNLWASTACYRDSFAFCPVTYGTFIYVHRVTFCTFLYVQPLIYCIFIRVHPVTYCIFINLLPAKYGEFIYANGICIYMDPVTRGRFIYAHPVMYIYSYSNNSLIETKYRLFYSKTTLTFMLYCLHSLCLFVVVLCGGFQQATYHSGMTNRVELWDTETELAQVWYGGYSFSLFPGLSLYRTGGFAL